MVKEVVRKDETVYVCEACGHVYREKVWAYLKNNWLACYTGSKIELLIKNYK